MAIPIAYGADWSERQISGDQLTISVDRDNNRTFPVDVVLRYADFVGQDHAPLTADEYRSHLAAGKRSYLIMQKGTADPAGGAAGGRAFGAEAVAYARSINYKTGSPIFFCADGWAAAHGYTVETAMEFFAETTRVVREAGFLGGIYGFADVILTALARGIGDTLWLCGDRAGLFRPDGELTGAHLYQWNNGRVWIEASPGVWVPCDLVEQYLAIGDDTMDDATIDKIAARTANLVFETELGTEIKPGQVNVANFVRTNTQAFDKDGKPWPISTQVLDTALDQSGRTVAKAAVSSAVAEVDEAALADELAKRGVGAAFAAEVKAALIEVLRKGTDA